jgi:hypothetical protein
MKAQAVFQNLVGRGVRVWAEAGSIKLDAPQGTLIEQDRRMLLASKVELLAILNDLTKAEGLLAAIDRVGATINIEQTPISVELRVGNLTRLPAEVWNALMTSDAQMTADLWRLVSVREKATVWAAIGRNTAPSGLSAATVGR